MLSAGLNADTGPAYCTSFRWGSISPIDRSSSAERDAMMELSQDGYTEVTIRSLSACPDTGRDVRAKPRTLWRGRDRLIVVL